LNWGIFIVETNHSAISAFPHNISRSIKSQNFVEKNSNFFSLFHSSVFLRVQFTAMRIRQHRKLFLIISFDEIVSFNFFSICFTFSSSFVWRKPNINNASKAHTKTHKYRLSLSVSISHSHTLFHFFLSLSLSLSLSHPHIHTLQSLFLIGYN